MERVLLNTALTSDLDLPVGETAVQLGREIAHAFGPSCLAALHYGSRLHKSAVASISAYDFFVILESARDAFESFAHQQRSQFSARAATAISGVLPPSVMGVRGLGLASENAKCVVLTLDDLAWTCSAKSRDHFIKGRVVQPLRLVWCRDGRARDAIEACLVDARAGTFAWVRPRLMSAFNVTEYCALLVDTSYRAEVRLDTPARAAEVATAHAPVLHRLYSPLLDQLCDSGQLVRDGASFGLVHSVTLAERWRVRRYLAQSKVRGVLRWPKSAILYDRWFDYVRGKARRILTTRRRS